ncbi:MAG: LamG domain-containing protein, partial [Candidatus Shapirobacteria bacterium]|nr:LamG domain-containing protein [Candidatus Shapirobacteria bacterium]
NGSNNYIGVSHSSNLSPTSAITFSAWAYKSSWTDSEESRILSKTETGGYTLLFTNGNIYTYIYRNGTYATPNANTTELSPGWHYFTGSYDGRYTKIYIDGILKNTNDAGSNYPITYSYDNSLIIGAEAGSGTTPAGQYFTGKIDHVKIYNYARTPAQIAYDYNKGAPIAHWKLDECQGLTAFDSSGSGYTGSINIGPSGNQTSVGTCQIGTSAAWTNGASGKINSSLNFDGTDDYYITPQPQIQTSPNLFTVTGFINPENQNGYIINPISCGYDQRLAYDASNQRLIVQIAESSDTNERSRTSTNNSVPINNWTHFAYSINDKDIKIYINGQLNAQYTEAINICGWTGNWYFGQRGLNTSWFKGRMDDIRIYNYALTSEQVKTVYNNGAINFN